MAILQWLFSWARDRKVEDWAETVAARSLDAVWQVVHDRAASLGGNTLRGYIRARGSSIIRSEIARVEQFVDSISDESRRRVFERALDELTHRVMLRAATTRRYLPARKAA